MYVSLIEDEEHKSGWICLITWVMCWLWGPLWSRDIRKLHKKKCSGSLSHYFGGQFKSPLRDMSVNLNHLRKIYNVAWASWNVALFCWSHMLLASRSSNSGQMKLVNIGLYCLPFTVMVWPHSSSKKYGSLIANSG